LTPELSSGKHIGLGLHVSKQIVMSFNGQLDFISEWQNGSTFIFSFEVEIDDQEEQIENQTTNIIQQAYSSKIQEENSEDAS
jgi:C4-dicarboxylate-specific signal transduction histidine kinase